MSAAICFFLGAIAFLLVLLIICVVNICTIEEEEDNNPLGKGKVIFFKENTNLEEEEDADKTR